MLLELMMGFLNHCHQVYKVF